MTKKMCKHNRMTEVLPGLWIGGSNKHTEITARVNSHEWGTFRIQVVENVPSKHKLSAIYFVCPNYGIPSYSVDYWRREVAWYKSNALYEVTTIVTDLGGHGRSGLYCAILMAVVLNLSGQEAIARLRQMHCEQAVETAEQEAYVIRIVDELRNWKG